MEDARCHFDLDLNVKTARDRQEVETRITILKGYINGGIEPLKLANKHLLGLLYYYINKLDESYDTFKSIVDEDPTNLNALANLAHVCRGILSTKEAAEYESCRNQVYDNADELILARFKAEHAYALAFEIYHSTHESRRYHRSNEMYDECLSKISEKADAQIERAAWMICKIWNFKKLFNRNYLKEQEKFKNKAMYDDIMHLLLQIQNNVPEDSTLAALAWANFGYFFWKKPCMPSHKKGCDDMTGIQMPSEIKGTEMEKFYDDPKSCFERALQIKEHKEVLELYGSWLLHKTDFDTSVKIFSRSIKLDSSDSSYFSYCKRAECRLTKCQKANTALNELMKAAERSVDITHDLELAVEDFELVVRVNPTAYTYRQLGRCFLLLSKRGKDKRIRAKALAAYQKGLACLDGKKDPCLHFKHAECLKALGEDTQARVSMQRSVENQNPQSTFVLDIEFLMTWYMELCNDGSTEIIPEAAFWFKMAFSKYSRKEFKTMTVALINTDIDFFIKLFGCLWKDASPQLEEFIMDVLKDIEDSLSNSRLHQFLSSSRSTGSETSTKEIRDSGAMRPRNKKGFEYDFFIVHSNRDGNWVKFSLLHHMEIIRNFKGLIDMRDFKPGKTILENIEEAIRDSYKVILYITDNFTQSDWCNHEAQTALTRALTNRQKGSIIPIREGTTKVPDFLSNVTNLNIEEGVIGETDLERLVQALDE
ncbi:tetratricopeptide repeat protein 22 [Patella vulgata]|uniref:tetratricopeptide repeat protein 22 n=1 Tax=Patella vulgata TaxID=6465 RepID=UPI0021804120|nr:tetratricopeptide repeat protein 22 [Patella vulgata]